MYICIFTSLSLSIYIYIYICYVNPKMGVLGVLFAVHYSTLFRTSLQHTSFQPYPFQTPILASARQTQHLRQNPHVAVGYR